MAAPRSPDSLSDVSPAQSSPGRRTWKKRRLLSNLGSAFWLLSLGCLNADPDPPSHRATPR